MEQFLALPVWAQALAATLFTYLMTAAGASLVFFTKRGGKKFLTAASGLAAGIMIAASFFSLLLPALEQAGASGRASAALVLTVGFLAGGAFIMLSDVLLSRMAVFKGRNKGGALMCAAMTLHNIPEGFAVGVAFGSLAGAQGALISAVMLAVGIGIQNFPEGLCVAMPLRRGGMRAGRAFFVGQASGFAEVPAGVLGALAVGFVSALLPWALAFSAGAMIAVVCSELIPESFSENKFLASLGVVAGFTLMMFLDIFLG